MTNVNILRSVLEALYMAFAMFWEILWPLILGFAADDVIRMHVVAYSEHRERGRGLTQPVHPGLFAT
jgi:hypothetical protein